MNKEELRGEILNYLRSLSSNEIQSLSSIITDQIIKFLNQFPHLVKKVGGGFLPLKAEVAPDYSKLTAELGVSWAFPVEVENGMIFGIPRGEIKTGPWLTSSFDQTVLDWVLVPGVGFDFEGARLGRGKGFYDRYLADKSLMKIGVCSEKQLRKVIPVEKHDCHMDFIITENFCWDVNQQKKI